MRFAGAVIAAAAAQVVAFLRVGDWIGASATAAIGYLLFAALGAGFFAARRAALAGFLSVLLAAASYGVIAYGAGAPGAGVGDLIGWELRLLTAVLPYAAGGGAAGACGGWLRARALRLAR